MDKYIKVVFLLFSHATASVRSKEVSMRKVLGASGQYHRLADCLFCDGQMAPEFRLPDRHGSLGVYRIGFYRTVYCNIDSKRESHKGSNLQPCRFTSPRMIIH